MILNEARPGAGQSRDDTTAEAPVVEIQDARFPLRAGEDAAWNGVELSMARGTMTGVRLGAGRRGTPLADAVSGLRAPERGTVRWQGRDWQGLTLWQAARCRGRIGRVFSGPGWVSNLNVDENILLGATHHRIQRRASLREAAGDLARRFGLDGLPAGRAGELTPRELQLAQCVRAFLGDPRLLLLEEPGRHLEGEDLARLADAVARARAQGAAVVWITSQDDLDRDPGCRADAWYLADGPALRKMEAAG